MGGGASRCAAPARRRLLSPWSGSTGLGRARQRDVPRASQLSMECADVSGLVGTHASLTHTHPTKSFEAAPVNIEKPIFIVGIGRSGTTVFHEMLAQHPHAAWLSRLCDDYPSKPLRNRRLMQAVDYPLIGRYLRQRFKPLECYSFWERHCIGFSKPCRELVAADVAEFAMKRIRNALRRMQTSKRRRLDAKITGWPRLGYLQQIFGDAKFIHLVRDGRAVVNSRLQESWWPGWEGP